MGQRQFAVNALATIKNWPWTDAEYCMIAQALDDRTSIALAHTAHADPRFFLPPPPVPPSNKTLEEDFRDLLSALPSFGLDECGLYFMERALSKRYERKSEKYYEETSSPKYDEETSSPKAKYRLFLQALLRHSKLARSCSSIVKNKGLIVLRKVYEVKEEHPQISHTVGKILANLTCHEDLHHDIVKAGWVSIFAEWMRGDDLELVLHATKALANMDKDHDSKGKFQDGVYLYHPQYRSSRQTGVDIVFVHGLLGGPAFTWRQEPPLSDSSKKYGAHAEIPQHSSRQDKINNAASSDNTAVNSQSQGSQTPKGNLINHDQVAYSKCWPKDWLAKDCPNVRILTIEYDTSLSDWAPKCPYGKKKRTLHARSAELLEKLQQAGIGQRPIIWIGHSMGGLLIKKMLLAADKNPAINDVVNKTIGIVFFSVPHKGSRLASMAASKLGNIILFPSIEVTELVENSPPILTLHQHFRDLIFHKQIPLLSFGEGLPLHFPLGIKTQPVQPESSDPGFGQYKLMTDTDHLTICKPASRESPIYQAVLDFIFSCKPGLAIDNVLKVDLLDENILPNETM